MLFIIYHNVCFVGVLHVPLKIHVNEDCEPFSFVFPLRHSNFWYTFSMKFFKKAYTLAKIQLQDPEARLGIGMMVGIFFGIAIDNVGLGVALGIVFGASAYTASKKKNKKEDIVKTDEGA